MENEKPEIVKISVTHSTPWFETGMEPAVLLLGRIETIKQQLYEPKAIVINEAFEKKLREYFTGQCAPESSFPYVFANEPIRTFCGLSVFIKNDLADDEILIAYDPMHP